MQRKERDPTWPPRWAELDPRTIEFIARLNEQERRNLIVVGDLPDRSMERLKRMLALEDETWEAGIRLATRSASWARVTKRFPGIVLGLAAFIIASKTIWETVLPWARALLQGAKP